LTEEEEMMSTRIRKRRVTVILGMAVGLMLACSVSLTPPETAPTADATKVALEMQGTAMSLELTQSAMSAAQQPQATVPPPPVATDTEGAPPPPVPPAPAATEDVEARIKAARVLLYEDTDELGIGQWIQEALDGLGMDYVQTGGYSGHFMENLNSGAPIDLIIVGAENHDAITGEFWDVINTRLTRDKAALIVEVWYLDSESTGPISKILGPCGVRYRTYYDEAESIYWWKPTHEVFNEPNVVLPLLHYTRYWDQYAGNKLRDAGTGTATLLAGLSASPSSGEAVIASCFDGRVIIQSFGNHDYRESEIVALWQNYIHYTLKNHFAALE
jgi:hypothetical protein